MNTHTITATGQSRPLDSRVFTNSIDLVGRIGLALIFLLAGLNKIQNYQGSAQYLASAGLPEFLLPFAIAFEIIGAVLIVVGYHVRWTALAFAGFSVLTALLYHANVSDQTQFIMFFKNIALAGGFLIIAAHGAGRFSLDAKQGR